MLATKLRQFQYSLNKSVVYHLEDVVINYNLCWLFMIFQQIICSVGCHDFLNRLTTAILLQRSTDGDVFTNPLVHGLNLLPWHAMIMKPKIFYLQARPPSHTVNKKYLCFLLPYKGIAGRVLRNRGRFPQLLPRGEQVRVFLNLKFKKQRRHWGLNSRSTMYEPGRHQLLITKPLAIKKNPVPGLLVVLFVLISERTQFQSVAA